MEIHSNQKRVKDYQDEDRISNLPDVIRCHILSFMPLKSALKMSVLSKQWKLLWTQAPVLDLNEMPRSFMDNHRLTSHQITHFKKFVHKVLVHNDVPFLRFLKLDLRVFHRHDIQCINSWLDIIAKRDIRHIDVKYMHMDKPQIALPTNFLSRERLVVLTLHGNFYMDDKMLLHLPNLEVVHFSRLHFRNDEFMKRMLSGCLVLKHLTIEDCTGINNCLFVESLSLISLCICCVVRNTERVGIVIKTPNLKYLNLHDTLKHHVTGDLCSLHTASLSLEYENGLQVLQLVSTVTKLSLLNSYYLSYISKPPMFQNLTCLELDHAGALCTILGYAPKLKCLIVLRGLYVDKSLKFEAVPACLPRLEVVHFQRFRGKEVEFELVEYMLKFASMLKEMKIYIKSQTRKNDYERLMKLPRSSNSCQVLATFGNVTVEDLMKFHWY